MAKTLAFSVTKDDVEWDTYRGTGPGGQHRNKTESAVRLTHRPSGVVVQSQSDRSQHTNKRECLKQLAAHPKFKAWCLRRSIEMREGETLDQKVDKMLQPENLKIELRDGDTHGWVTLQANDSD